MSKSTIPYIIRIEKHYSGLIVYTESLLKVTNNYSKIAREIRKRFNCNMSRHSVRRFKDYIDSIGEKSNNKEEDNRYYYRIGSFFS